MRAFGVKSASDESFCPSIVSLGRSETLEFATGQIRQPTALLGEEIDAFSHF